MIFVLASIRCKKRDDMQKLRCSKQCIDKTLIYVYKAITYCIYIIKGYVCYADCLSVDLDSKFS